MQAYYCINRRFFCYPFPSHYVVCFALDGFRRRARAWDQEWDMSFRQLGHKGQGWDWSYGVQSGESIVGVVFIGYCSLEPEDSIDEIAGEMETFNAPHVPIK